MIRRRVPANRSFVAALRNAVNTAMVRTAADRALRWRCRRRLVSREKALQILLDHYWSPKGWNRHKAIDAADFAYARQAGYMFDPVTVTHDDIVARLLAVRNRLSIERIADAFLASLSTRRLEL